MHKIQKVIVVEVKFSRENTCKQKQFLSQGTLVPDSEIGLTSQSISVTDQARDLARTEKNGSTIEVRKIDSLSIKVNPELKVSPCNVRVLICLYFVVDIRFFYLHSYYKLLMSIYLCRRFLIFRRERWKNLKG